MFVRATVGLAACAIATAAAGQSQYGGWIPGSEITGQRVQVQTNGVTNTIDFERNGVAHIYSPSGATVVDATWTAADGQLCLTTANTHDCYPYTMPFQAGLPVDLISNCAVRSRWTTPNVTILPGERG
jgi:hypothetical protein